MCNWVKTEREEGMRRIKMLLTASQSKLKVFLKMKWPKTNFQPATENGQNLQEQVVVPTASNEQTNEQLNIVHGVFESEPSVLNLVENCPAQRPRGRPYKNPISDQISFFFSSRKMNLVSPKDTLKRISYVKTLKSLGFTRVKGRGLLPRGSVFEFEFKQIFYLRSVLIPKLNKNADISLLNIVILKQYAWSFEKKHAMELGYQHKILVGKLKYENKLDIACQFLKKTSKFLNIFLTFIFTTIYHKIFYTLY
ncbi:hypothetical protein BpHYR1_030697 [Brachionus plicatilis]|uniref:Uncharacterized protein n=1 Tax=Brachionus plicatilis TaxID=10195 RepID=A0A3M7SFQ4_BRAPC|nr:hypothetical protein BpHYR1_030697 [Brachionus plicatilis]